MEVVNSKHYQMLALDRCLRQTHVTIDEACCHDLDRTMYPEHRIADGTLSELVAVFEDIREAVGCPIVISCMYRTPDHNRAVGGGEHSQHLEGKAMDLLIPKTVEAETFYGILKHRAAHDKRIGGLGLYNAFVHVDIRDRKPDGGFAYWDFRR